MKNLKSLLALLLILIGTSITAFAQNDASGAACLVGGVIYIVVMVVILGITILIDVLVIKWIKKDATAKGMPNADTIKWLGLLNWLGAVIYLLMRPKTNQ